MAIIDPTSFPSALLYLSAYSCVAKRGGTLAGFGCGPQKLRRPYDNIYELQSVTQGGSTTESYTYDPVGNRLTSLGSSSWSYNTSNELTSRPSYSYTYDANGNTQTMVNSSGTTTYSWDYDNRLTSATLPGSGGTVSYRYDPLGRRIYKSSGSGTSIYAYDGLKLVEETNSSGAAVARYSQGADIDEPLAELRSGTTSYYQADGLGSLTSLSNAAGALANTYTYDSFGNIVATSGSIVNNFRYTGREWDPETSLYYYRARYYDPQTARFVSEDPIEFAGGADFYRYALNDPIGHRDPWGLKPGDRYDSAKIAALQALIDVLAKSNAEGVEYAGVVYRNWDGSYSYTAPRKGTPTSSEPGSCPWYKHTVGTYHTHPDVPGYDSYEPSADDLFGDFIHLEYGWIALPDGTVIEDPPIGPWKPIGKIPGGIR